MTTPYPQMHARQAMVPSLSLQPGFIQDAKAYDLRMVPE